MKKNYEVTLTGWARVLVIGAESPEKAMEYAQLKLDRLPVEEAEIHCEITTPEDLERSRRHADAISEDE